MTSSLIEREDKFDAEPDFVLPDVTGLLPEGARVETSSARLRSYYFDTDDHALLRADMTLRRRTGSTDTGWQLKVPHRPAREEIRVDGNGNARKVPDSLQELLLGTTRGRRLRQVASVTTQRDVHHLLGPDGVQLAEIDDDAVQATAGGAAATVMTWREIEVELVDGDEALLAGLGKRLRKAGARPAASASKLARTLLAQSTTEHAPAKPDRVNRAAEPMLAYIAEQHRVLLAGDLALRRGQDEVIHKTRVAVRRLRSTLRTFAVLVEKDQASSLDTELRWFAGLLGEVRDRQVLRARLDKLVGDLPVEMVLGPVRARIDTELRREQTEHWERLQTEMTGRRYLDLLEALASWVRHPPLTAMAEKSASKLQKLERLAEHKVAKRLARANVSGDVDELHRARKAAKRARYAAELIEPLANGKGTKTVAGRYEHLQNLLGEHQDSLVSSDLLRRLGAIAGTTPGENGFSFGVLYQRERERAQAVREKAREEAASYS